MNDETASSRPIFLKPGHNAGDLVESSKWKVLKEEYGLVLVDDIRHCQYDAIVLAVDHSEFKQWGEALIRSFGRERHVLYDVKHVLPQSQSDLRL